ncbi:MAG: hypothetical protein M1305_03925 [Candidatus Marsarchaeota archaeon]|nr:hypothetical protein [Candidatus Marsarchaeota archaeon]
MSQELVSRFLPLVFQQVPKILNYEASAMRMSNLHTVFTNCVMIKNRQDSTPFQKERTMSETTITLPVDAKSARVYQTASPEDRKKIRLLLRLRLRELAELPTSSLTEIMDDIGAKARARGLTPEIMEDLLRDE